LSYAADRETDADERLTPVTVVGVSNKLIFKHAQIADAVNKAAKPPTENQTGTSLGNAWTEQRLVIDPYSSRREIQKADPEERSRKP